MDRDLAGAQCRDLGFVDVHCMDVVAELGEAGSGHEADPADADDADRLSLAHGSRHAYFGAASSIALAISSICCSSIDCNSELVSQ